jgi:hypothetical protein
VVDLLSALRRRGADWIGDDMPVLLPSADEKRNMLPESADPARSGVGMKKAGGLFPGYALRNGWTLAARQVITTWENHTVQSKPSQRENVGVRLTARQCWCETTEAGRHRDNAVTNAGTVENPEKRVEPSRRCLHTTDPHLAGD